MTTLTADQTEAQEALIDFCSSLEERVNREIENCISNGHCFDYGFERDTFTTKEIKQTFANYLKERT